jgi:low temperature requirement protein LtrA
MVGMNFVAAIIYLGIFFGFKDHNTKVYVAWYVVSILEILATVGLSLRWKVLSFTGTHLINRMAMLTFIMIGEGVIVVAKGVGSIVVNADSWSKSLAAHRRSSL